MTGATITIVDRHGKVYWEEFAACRDIGPDLFYPVDGENRKMIERRETKAKAICAVCPVREPCLNYALTHNEYGIWGGMNSQERDVYLGRNIRRNRK